MVTECVVDAILITILVCFCIMILGCVIYGIKYVCKKIIVIKKAREFEKRNLEERFEWIHGRIDDANKAYYQLSERISKLEEKKKNVKKK